MSAFRTRGPTTEPISEFIVACPYPDELAQDGTQRGNVLSRTGDARSRGYKRRERESLFVSSSPRDPLRRKALDLPFIDARRGSRCTMGV
jgi:hypothetical protein